MSVRYELKKGTYFIGDPAIFIRKNQNGEQFVKKLWDLFYLDMNLFQHLEIDGIEFYITRTAEGDGYFDGIGTDTGTIMIIRIDDLSQDERFHHQYPSRGCKLIEVIDKDGVMVESFNIYFDNGLSIRTHEA
jgi:hypothetical protein